MKSSSPIVCKLRFFCSADIALGVCVHNYPGFSLIVSSSAFCVKLACLFVWVWTYSGESTALRELGCREDLNRPS